MTVNTVSMDALYRDLYPGDGQRIKQWVVDARKDREWVLSTCPRVEVPPHRDNCGSECRNVPSVIWEDLDHDCCGECNNMRDALTARPDVVDWLDEYSRRPPLCRDLELFSDEIAAMPTLEDHPMLKMVRK